VHDAYIASPAHEKVGPAQGETKVSRYGERYWAVYLNGQLLAVTVYKKGALAVQEALESLSQANRL
jgi:hypothetical protein